MAPIAHGGRLQAAMRRHPDAPRPWIDLSTGINPTPYPFTPPGPGAWQRLPEPEDVASLEAAAARAYGMADPAGVVAAPGTQALIQLLPRLFPRPRIHIPGPTYAEHEAAWRSAGSVLTPEAPALVLCNPNNPDAARTDPAILAAIAWDLLVVDEAYADFEPGLSLAPHLPRPNTIVLRSFGKAYGLAGLRLGFALATPDAACAIRSALGPWAISGPAVCIGLQALSDTHWRVDAAQQAWRASVRLQALLRQVGFSPVGGTSLFQTADCRDPSHVAGTLARAGILVRQFDHSPGRLRFGLPPDDQAWARLAAALQVAVRC